MELTGKVALVTGSAKRLGRTIAEALAEAGADIAVHYNRSAEAAAATADALRQQTGRRVEAFQANLAEPEQIKRLFGDIAEAFGRLDVLVNCAALYTRTPLDTLTAEQWDREMAVNARAPALCIRHALPLMADGSVIVNITDIAAERAFAGYPAYCAAKAAVQALTKSAAKALAGRNIRVNAVAPGAILWEEDRSEADQKRVLAQVPMKRAGAPANIAQAVLYFIGNDYVTAQTLRVDGGWHMG